MGVQITDEYDNVAFFDTVTMTAFGPVMNWPDADEFLEWYTETHDEDLRKLSLAQIVEKVEEWRRSISANTT